MGLGSTATRAATRACAALALLAFAGGCPAPVAPGERDYRIDMRRLVQRMSAYAKGVNPAFRVLAQDGLELLTETGSSVAPVSTAYVAALDGVGQEDVFYGQPLENLPTTGAIRNELLPLLDTAHANRLSVLVTDYAWSPAYVDDAHARCAARGYLSFCAETRALDSVPAYPAAPFGLNARAITTPGAAANFLYLLDTARYKTRDAYLAALRAAGHDLLIIDPAYEDGDLTAEEVTSLKVKPQGGTRLVMAYLSIGQAEDYRFYWRPEWDATPPDWLLEPDPDWPGNYYVRYWDSGWHDVLFGHASAALDRIQAAGFDGVYLDKVDAFEHFEP